MQNVVLSIGMKLVFLALAATGGVNMWAAIFADVGMSLIVTLNGMRALRISGQPSALSGQQGQKARA
jgi:Cd2+/Zn2+-exporting ATPase